MLRVGIVRLGNISSRHIPAWQTIYDAEITAVCDCREELLCKVPHARGYTDFVQMLQQEKLDIVDICVPTYLHTVFALSALGQGIHVICEKPISLEKNDVQKLYSVAKKKGVVYGGPCISVLA